MPSTSVHFPPSLLEELDRLAVEKGVSRNRLITEACQETLHKRREWPSGFFDNSRFSREDLKDLQMSAEAFEKDLTASRRNRDTPPF